MITSRVIALTLVVSACFGQTAVFPGGLVTDSQLKVALNNSQTAITSAITNSQVSIPVSSCSPIVNNQIVTIDVEVFSVTSCTGTTMLVGTRPFGDAGNVANTHASGAIVNGYIDSWHHNSLRVEVEAIESALGVNLSGISATGTITSGIWHGTAIGSAYGGTGINNGSNTLTLGGNVTFSGAYNPTFVIPASGSWTFPAAGTLVNSGVTSLSSLATVGTIGTGIWQGTLISPTYGGSGVNNGSSTLTLGGNVTFSGAYNPTFVIPGSGSWTFPAVGTLIGSADTGTVTNAMLAGSIAASKLVGSDIATVGTITSGIWHGTLLGAAYGGTGVNNGSKTLTFSNSLTLAGTDSTTMTFPSTSASIARTDAGQTFTGADTFTAPILNNPVISGPAPVACGAGCSPTAGQLVYCATAAGCTMSLPTSSGSGSVIRERITVALTSAAEKVLLTTTSDVIIGSAIGENAGTPLMFVGNAGTYHSIQMPNAGTKPSGGFAGDLITCTDMAVGTWACDVVFQAGTTPTTPYSSSTT